MRRLSRLALLALLPALGGAAPAATATELALTHASRVRLAGTTNVNSWSCSGDSLRGAASVAASPAALAAQLAAWEARPAGSRLDGPGAPRWPADFELVIPIAALDCANRAMERDMHAALDAARHPEIRYRFRHLREARLTASGPQATYTLVVDGELTLAGRTRPVGLTVTAIRDGHRFRLRGHLTPRMTDYGVEPPVALFGLIRARDELRVSVDLELVAPAAAGLP